MASASDGGEDDPGPRPWFALHGFAGSPELWDGIFPSSAAAAAPLLPGHGGAPIVAGDWHDVVAALAAHVVGPHLVGYSLGARLALAIALAAPQRVARLVLIGGTPGIPDDAQRRARRDWDEAQARQIEADLPAWADRWEQLPVFAGQTDLPPRVRQRQRAWRRDHDPTGLAWAMRTLGQGHMPNLWPALPRLTMPVVYVAGARDEKYVAIAHRAAALSPRAQVVTVAGAGHNPILERPLEVHRIITVAPSRVAAT
ncbi:MAG: alpha/beta fold hydrolase [Myxococcota bacterium]